MSLQELVRNHTQYSEDVLIVDFGNNITCVYEKASSSTVAFRCFSPTEYIPPAGSNFDGCGGHFLGTETHHSFSEKACHFVMQYFQSYYKQCQLWEEQKRVLWQKMTEPLGLETRIFWDDDDKKAVLGAYGLTLIWPLAAPCSVAGVLFKFLYELAFSWNQQYDLHQRQKFLSNVLRAPLNAVAETVNLFSSAGEYYSIKNVQILAEHMGGNTPPAALCCAYSRHHKGKEYFGQLSIVFPDGLIVSQIVSQNRQKVNIAMQTPAFYAHQKKFFSVPESLEKEIRKEPETTAAQYRALTQFKTYPHQDHLALLKQLGFV